MCVSAVGYGTAVRGARTWSSLHINCLFGDIPAQDWVFLYIVFWMLFLRWNLGYVWENDPTSHRRQNVERSEWNFSILVLGSGNYPVAGGERLCPMSWITQNNCVKMIKKAIYLYMYVCGGVCAWVQLTEEVRRGRVALWSAVTGSCELPDMGDWNHSPALCS